MSSKHYLAIAEISNIILNVIMWLALGWAFEIFALKQITAVPLLGILLIVVYSYLTRVYTNKFILYLIFQFIMLASVAFIPYNWMEKVLLLIVSISFFILNFAYWFANHNDGFTYVAIGFALLPAAGYLYADIMHIRAAMTLYFVLGVSYIILYYIRLLSINAFSLSQEKKEMDKMPFEDMIKNDSKLSVPFIVISAVLMILSRFDAIDTLALKVYLVFADLLGKAILFVLNAIDVIYNFLFGSEAVYTERVPLGNNFEEAKESPFFNTVSWVIFFLIGALLIFLMIKTLISVIKSIVMKRELASQTIKDEDGMIETREKIVKVKKKHDDKLSKIRKKYKRTIEKKAKAGYKIDKSHTPFERANDIKTKLNDDIFELNQMYEKERYQNK